MTFQKGGEEMMVVPRFGQKGATFSRTRKGKVVRSYSNPSSSALYQNKMSRNLSDVLIPAYAQPPSSEPNEDLPVKDSRPFKTGPSVLGKVSNKGARRWCDMYHSDIPSLGLPKYEIPARSVSHKDRVVNFTGNHFSKFTGDEEHVERKVVGGNLYPKREMDCVTVNRTFEEEDGMIILDPEAQTKSGGRRGCGDWRVIDKYCSAPRLETKDDEPVRATGETFVLQLGKFVFKNLQRRLGKIHVIEVFFTAPCIGVYEFDGDWHVMEAGKTYQLAGVTRTRDLSVWVEPSKGAKIVKRARLFAVYRIDRFQSKVSSREYPYEGKDVIYRFPAGTRIKAVRFGEDAGDTIIVMTDKSGKVLKTKVIGDKVHFTEDPGTWIKVATDRKNVFSFTVRFYGEPVVEKIVGAVLPVMSRVNDARRVTAYPKRSRIIKKEKREKKSKRKALKKRAHRYSKGKFD